MFKFRKQKKIQRIEYDASVWKPVLKCSICTGEQVAGFLNRKTGQFEERTLIRNEDELREFLDACGVDEIEKIY